MLLLSIDCIKAAMLDRKTVQHRVYVERFGKW
jgi:hypothetical protein